MTVTFAPRLFIGHEIIRSKWRDCTVNDEAAMQRWARMSGRDTCWGCIHYTYAPWDSSPLCLHPLMRARMADDGPSPLIFGVPEPCGETLKLKEVDPECHC